MGKLFLQCAGASPHPEPVSNGWIGNLAEMSWPAGWANPVVAVSRCRITPLDDGIDGFLSIAEAASLPECSGNLPEVFLALGCKPEPLYGLRWYRASQTEVTYTYKIVGSAT